MTIYCKKSISALLNLEGHWKIGEEAVAAARFGAEAGHYIFAAR